MNIELMDVFWLVLLGLGLWHWWNAQGIKHRALSAVKEYCDKIDVQLLDDGIALKAFWLKRDPRGNMRIWRSYQFEFSSTGNERYRGVVILLGSVVQSIDAEPHRVH